MPVYKGDIREEENLGVGWGGLVVDWGRKSRGHCDTETEGGGRGVVDFHKKGDLIVELIFTSVEQQQQQSSSSKACFSPFALYRSEYVNCYCHVALL